MGYRIATRPVTVRGYRDFRTACVKAGPDSRKEFRRAFSAVGDIVRQDARAKIRGFDPASPKTASGLSTVVRSRGVSVEQRKRRTIGKRPDWGAIQMNDALLPALDDNTDEIDREMDKAIDRIADHFEK